MSLVQKLERYCAYQDRCTFDVVRKLEGWNVPKPTQEKLITQLRKEGFLDDHRFARSFVRGKFNVNRWGRIRIAYELRARNIPGTVVSEALGEIDEEAYLEVIRSLIVRKKGEINPEKIVHKREKIINFVVGKGFELDLVLRIIKEINI